MTTPREPGFGEENYTGSLELYMDAIGADPNAFWRMSCGHHQNLLDEAIERLQTAGALKNWPQREFDLHGHLTRVAEEIEQLPDGVLKERIAQAAAQNEAEDGGV